MFEKPTVSACRGLILTKVRRFLLLLPQECRALPSATRTTVPAPRGERRRDPQSGSITAASADQRAPKSSAMPGAGPHVRSPSRPGADTAASPLLLCGRTAPTLQGPASNVRQPLLRGAEALASQPAPDHPALKPALGLEAASASGLRGLVLSAEAPGRLSSTWVGSVPPPADSAHRPCPGPAKPCSYWLMFPPPHLWTRPWPAAPGTAWGPSGGNCPHSSPV